MPRVGSRHSAMPPRSRTAVLQELKGCQVSALELTPHPGSDAHRWPDWPGSWEAATLVKQLSIWTTDCLQSLCSGLRQLVRVHRAGNPDKQHEDGLARTKCPLLYSRACMIPGPGSI